MEQCASKTKIGLGFSHHSLPWWTLMKNLEEQRIPLWEDLVALSQTLEDPWCVLGDFNSVLHQGERIGGLDVTDGDTKDKGFKDMVKHSLAQNQKGSKLKTLQQVLCSFKHPLKQLNQSRYVDIYMQQARARNKLLQTQALLQQDPFNSDLLQKEASSRDHYIAINHSVILLIKQQSKAEWIGYGDECSRIFMARIKQRKALISIFHIQDQNNQRVEGFKAVLEVLTNYYKGLLGTMEHHRTHIDLQVMELGNGLTIEQQIMLCQPFKDSEIKKVLFSIPNHKSPSPDGYNSGVYKACWEDIDPLVCSAIKEFFTKGTLPSFYRQTKLVLLPKVPNPERVNDLRPISCCNIIYKCITKLLYNRIKEVLPHIIDAGQGAFVKGKELLFNVLLCQDLARGYQRKHTPPSCIMKVDLHKGFDSVHWEFIKELLNALRFPILFTQWIMRCITLV
ncbi:hypothetical protein Cgig2_015758 [Carnegiea gigantea]|uniref:Reverse transcriptase domain-containing protein n=1 Tax=Carnegiea gigantea TaxID=171969 RepID=A0A9Q1GG61_9CARY|nr:hypothetical protein Cgig2_015758 [Carnegiea gigantea]